MSTVLLEAAWPEPALGQALLALARATGLAPRGHLTQGPALQATPAALDQWLIAAGDHVGIRVQPVEAAYAELRRALAGCAPALVALRQENQPRYLAVLRARGRRLKLLTPALRSVWIESRLVERALNEPLERLPLEYIGQWLATVPLATGRQRARQGLLHAVLAEARVGGLWLLEMDPGAPFLAQLRRRGLVRRAGFALALSLGQVAITLWGWALLGQAALNGLLEPGWLAACALALGTGVWLQLTALSIASRLIHDVAALLKQRLLCGALRLDPDQIRSRGSGRLLALVSESEALEQAGLAGAAGALIATLQLASAAVVLALGASGALALTLLLTWCGLIACGAVRFWRLRNEWTEQRLGLARSFVENVVGYRTRNVQQREARWHLQEDQQLDRYLQLSERLDQTQARLTSVPANGWFVLGFLGLVPAVLAHAPAPDLMIGIGGLLQAYGAFGGLGAAAVTLASAAVAWRQVGELFDAAAVLPSSGPPELVLPAAPQGEAASDSPGPALDVRGLSYRYRAGGDAVLRNCNLTLRASDRVLLEGKSGGGKSTLAALLVGLRTPESGHVLLQGLDRCTLGDVAWRRRLASAPQFHENHILSGSLAFNLLLSRAWPASDSDRREAQAVCIELGLGPLLRRMPSGLNQIIGETGWQLSHGERSRIFLARALLQGAAVVVLDETFGALDPLTLRHCMEATFRRAPALIVIAHP